LEKHVQLKIKGKIRLVEKRCPRRDQINRRNHKKNNIPTHKIRLAR